MTDNQLPHSIEAENAVIASCLIDPDAYAVVRAILEPADFHTDNARLSFEAMGKCYPGIDSLTVFDAAGGQVDALWLKHIEANIPTSVHAEHYARIVAEKAFQRRLIDAGGQIAAEAYSNGSASADLFARAQEILYQTEPQSAGDIIDAKGQAERMLTMVDRRRDTKQSGGLPFGYIDLDRLTGGMYPGNLVVVGSRPGMGKSQILAETDCYLRGFGKGVMVASAEMTLDEWNEREIAIATGISVRQQREGGLTDEQHMAIGRLVDIISRQTHYWLEEPVTINRIVNKARVLQRTVGIDILLVDYLQLLADTVPKGFGDSVRERVGYISRTLKRLAKELEIPIFAAVQLNREIEARPDKRPRMADIKECGDIEQDADVVILLHRPSMYKPDDQPNVTHLYVPKVRQIGVVERISLFWQAERCRHFDMIGNKEGK